MRQVDDTLTNRVGNPVPVHACAGVPASQSRHTPVLVPSIPAVERAAGNPQLLQRCRDQTSPSLPPAGSVPASRNPRLRREVGCHIPRRTPDIAERCKRAHVRTVALDGNKVDASLMRRKRDTHGSPLRPCSAGAWPALGDLPTWDLPGMPKRRVLELRTLGPPHVTTGSQETRTPLEPETSSVILPSSTCTTARQAQDASLVRSRA